MKRVVVSVTNDLVTDNRVHKVCTSLSSFGFEILLVGRKLINSETICRIYPTKRFRLIFNKGPLFYAEYNFRLFFFLLFVRVDIMLSNDLDTLYANYLASKFRNKKLVYDSHEYFTEVPELIGRKRTQNIWKKIERRIVPKIKNAYTVCESLANIYNEKYKVSFKVVRNVPLKIVESFSTIDLAILNSKKVILYQGALNIGRGIEKMISAMKYLENSVFVIIGSGDITENLKLLVEKEGVAGKVIFLGRIPFEKLSAYTKLADIGISLEENRGLNYYYSLPNKIFDYIQAGVPVIVSDFPEMKRIIEDYKVGICISENDPEKLAVIIKEILTDEFLQKEWKCNLFKAAEDLCWEKEEKILKKIYEEIS